MQYVSVTPEAMTAAAVELAGVDAAIDGAHRTAMPTILDVAPAAADEVSSGIARLFCEHAADYQVAAGQAAAFQERFVQNLTAGSAAYSSMEDVIVALLQGLDTAVRSIPLAYASGVAQFITSANLWMHLVPGPLQAFVAGVPFLSIFTFAVPFALVSAVIQATIAAIAG